MSHPASETDLLDLVDVLRQALWQCLVWRHAPDQVDTIAYRSLMVADLTLDQYDDPRDDLEPDPRDVITRGKTVFERRPDRPTPRRGRSRP